MNLSLVEYSTKFSEKLWKIALLIVSLLNQIPIDEDLLYLLLGIGDWCAQMSCYKRYIIEMTILVSDIVHGLVSDCSL